MPSQQNEPIEEVLRNYDLNVNSIKNETYKEKKGVWWVETDKGLKVLKKISNSEDTLKYILSAIKHLCENGVLIPKINRTKDDYEYARISEVCYIMLDAVSGKAPSYDSLTELEIIVGGLANFHKASKGFRVNDGTKPKIHLDTWIQDYKDQLEDMKKFYEVEKNKGSHDEIGIYILENFSHFYDRGIHAIDLLNGNEYRQWTEEVRLHGGLCHQDFAAGNLVLSGKQLFVLDTDSITIDIGARDLRKLINKIFKKKGKWDIELMKNILNYYQKVNPLTYSQWQVVKMDLIFPHLFLGAMNKYYYQRDKEWSFEKYFKRIKEMAEFEKSSEQVISKFDDIIPSKAGDIIAK